MKRNIGPFSFFFLSRFPNRWAMNKGRERDESVALRLAYSYAGRVASREWSRNRGLYDAEQAFQPLWNTTAGLLNGLFA